MGNERGLVIKNDWQYLTYHWPDGTKALDEQRGGTARVRWADGSESMVTFTPRVTVSGYSDHGRPNAVRQFRPVARVDHRGSLLAVDLVQLDVLSVDQS